MALIGEKLAAIRPSPSDEPEMKTRAMRAPNVAALDIGRPGAVERGPSEALAS